MYTLPIVFFLVVTFLIGYFIHKTATYEVDVNNKEQKNGAKNLPPEILQITANEYISQPLINVYYSIVNNYIFDLNSVHSIDNAICLEFKDDKWISIMFNTNLELFQISNLNPNDLELEYELTKMNIDSKWVKFINRRVKKISIKYQEENGFSLPKDLILQFENEQVTISFTEEIISEPKVIMYGIDWILIQFSRKTYNELRKKYR